jgi:hypothetical protein
VPSHDEERVRNTHCIRITCNGPDCPGSVRYVDGAKGHIRRHTCGNKTQATTYSLVIPLLSRSPPGRFRGSSLVRGQPWRSQLSGGSDAASAGSVAGGWCWQSHQVPPGHSSWRRFRHGTQIMPPLCGSVRPSASLQEPGAAGSAPQARMIRHRSNREWHGRCVLPLQVVVTPMSGSGRAPTRISATPESRAGVAGRMMLAGHTGGQTRAGGVRSGAGPGVSVAPRQERRETRLIQQAPGRVQVGHESRRVRAPVP